jgi:hypothetical protein
MGCNRSPNRIVEFFSRGDCRPVWEVHGPGDKSVNRWVLKIELNGEWEECSFPSQKEALAAFVALVSDYSQKLQRAVLLRPDASPNALALAKQAPLGASKYVN